MIEVYVNGLKVDYYNSSDFGIRLKREVLDQEDLTKRGGLHTYRFKLPHSTNNCKAFEYSNVMDLRDQFRRSRPYEITIISSGFKMLDGTAKITEVRDEYFLVEAVERNAGWIEDLKDKKLTDLPAASISFDAPDDGSNGFYAQSQLDPIADDQLIAFGCIAYGLFYDPNFDDTQFIINKFQTFEDFPPATYVYPILKRIFDGIGYSFRFPALETHKFLAMPYVGVRPFEWNWGNAECNMNVDTTTKTLTLGATLFPMDGVAGSGDGFRLMDISNQMFVAPVDGTYNYSLIGNLSIEDDSDSHGNAITYNIILRVRSADGTKIYDETIAINGTNSNPVNTTYDTIAETGTLELKKNENVRMFIDTSFTTDLGDFGSWLNGTLTITPSLDNNGNAFPTTLNPISQLPDMTQLEFIKNLVRLFNAFFEVNERDRIISFITADNYFRPPSSDDLEISKIMDFEIVPNKKYTKHKFRYKEDESNFLQDEYGNYDIDNPDIYGDGINEIEIGFAVPRLKVFDNNVLGFPPATDEFVMMAKQEDLEAFRSEQNWEYDREPSLVEFTPSSYQGVGFYDFNGLTPIAINMKEPFSPTGNSRAWFTFYEKYQTMINRLNRGYGLEVVCIIEPDQFSKLKFNRPVKIRNEWFYPTLIDNYDPETGKCELELIRI